MSEAPVHPTLREAVRFWVKLGFINFGGPAGQIALMHDELVDRRRWISPGRYLHALNYCMLLPGPEAHQLAIYVGWLLNGTLGGLAAGIFFILPAFFLMLVLGWVAAAHGDVTWVEAAFGGIAVAVIAIISSAVPRIGTKVLRNGVMVAIALVSFVALFLFGVPFPIVVLSAGLLGLIGSHRWPATFAVLKHEGSDDEGVVVHDDAGTPDHARASLGRAVRVVIIGLAVWWLPLLAVASLDLGTDVFADQARFFAGAALVTFGGAYAVLAYLNQAAVLTYGWVTTSQMATGLGLAESTPGPLIMVVQFVAFLGAWGDPGGLTPLAAGILGSVVAVWATFAPSFLFIFLGAPAVERLRGNDRLTGALSAITAAVVGVIASLAVTFGITTLFDQVRTVDVAWAHVPVPDLATIDVVSAVGAAIAFVGLWRWRWKVLPVVLAGAGLGMLRAATGL